MYEDFTQEPKDERAQKKRKARARKVEADRKPVRDGPRGMRLRRKIALGITFAFAAFSALALFAVINSADDYSPRDDEQIKYSDFYKKGDEIHALVVGAGYFAIPSADAASFRILDFGSGYRSNVAADKNAVYCGNIAMSELEPTRTKAVAFGSVIFATARRYPTTRWGRLSSLIKPWRIFFGMRPNRKATFINLSEWTLRICAKSRACITLRRALARFIRERFCPAPMPRACAR